MELLKNIGLQKVQNNSPDGAKKERPKICVETNLKNRTNRSDGAKKVTT